MDEADPEGGFIPRQNYWTPQTSVSSLNLSLINREYIVFISRSEIISFTASSVFDSDGEEGQEGREE